ncbi:MAG: hypothetical protein O2909_12470 [Chloroflexi bacterium]|nr:hypothetical protein [Chloroflexota bacterium]MDA1220228.1 hypothetical protein [Chloroflexota bacterium]
MTQRATRGKKSTGTAFLQLSCGDFQRNPDGTWESTRQIDLTGHGGDQMLIPAGRKFDKGQMFILGVDLAAVLQRQCG